MCNLHFRTLTIFRRNREKQKAKKSTRENEHSSSSLFTTSANSSLHLYCMLSISRLKNAHCPNFLWYSPGLDNFFLYVYVRFLEVWKSCIFGFDKPGLTSANWSVNTNSYGGFIRWNVAFKYQRACFLDTSVLRRRKIQWHTSPVRNCLHIWLSGYYLLFWALSFRTTFFCD